MASSTPLKDMEENFFLCPVCLDQFKEPKLLPCLHRYCKDCLKSVIQSSHDGGIKCPMCKEDYVIPENGVDGFKTDFHMTSVIEFIELQKSLEKKELKNCIDCSKKTVVTSYCFKCKNFLCDPCYQRHLNNTMFNDHQTHILNLENIDAKNLTLETLASLIEDPRCHNHIKQPALLCCNTCGNVPVCITCVYGKHKGHDLHDVTEIAKSERESLQQILDELNRHKSTFYEFPEKVKTAKRKLKDTLSKETATLRIQKEKQVNEIKAYIEVNNAEHRRHDRDIKYQRIDEENEIASKREEEINLVRKKYDEIMKIVKATYDKESKQVKKRHDEIEEELCLKLNNLESTLKTMTTAQELFVKHNENELQELLDHCEQIIKRYENFASTSTSILAAKDEWTDAQCIPDIRAASEPLIEEMKKTLPELESLSDLDIGGVDDINILNLQESVVVVEIINSRGWWIEGISSSSDGTIVLTGCALNEYTHVTVINRQGEILRQDKMMGNSYYPQRYCSFLSEFKVATVCSSIHNDLGIYDVRDGSYKKRNINDVIKRRSASRRVSCVATDPVKNHIIVGTNGRDVHVFEDQLNYSHTIILPDVIRYSCDITVHGSSLLICDGGGMKAYAVTTEGSESELLYEFTKPNLHGDYRAPLSACTDKNGFIFILWTALISRQRRCVLVQYSQDGQQLLTIRPVDKEAWLLTTLQTDETDKIMISTQTSGKLYIYSVYTDIDI